MAERALHLTLRAIQAWDRLRLWRLAALHPGLEIDSAASSNLAAARYDLALGARLRIGPRVVTERLAGALHFSLGPGAEVVVTMQLQCLMEAILSRNSCMIQH